MYSRSVPTYSALKQDDEAECNVSSTSKDSSRSREHVSECLTRKHRSWFLVSITSNIIMLGLLLGLAWARIRGGSCSSSPSNDNSINKALKDSSFYSPILDKVDLSPSQTVIDGSLFATGGPSDIYRMDPSPVVDAAWDLLDAEGHEIVMISGEEIRHLAKDPQQIVQAPESWGYGPDAYPVQVDVFHQVHCLNELRKEMHPDYYYGNITRDSLHHAHKKHCLHILLQNIMCHASVNVITHNWVEGTDRPFADFSITHQCRNFDALLDWVHNNSLTDVRAKFNSMEAPSNALRKPTPKPLDKYGGTA